MRSLTAKAAGSRAGLPAAGLAAVLALSPVAGRAQFVEHTIATDIRFGYQVLTTDVNGDGRPDVIGLGASMPELLWFENPSWEPHVIAGELAGMINMDAVDLDADGTPEIALAYGFSTNPARSIGNIAILKSAGDPRVPWTLTEIDAVPSSHRIRFGRVEEDGSYVLFNAPIVNEAASGLTDPERLPTPLVYYRPGDWKREYVTRENAGAVHGVLAWDIGTDGTDAVLTAGRLGIHAHRLGDDGVWSRSRLSVGVPEPYPDGGSSDLGAGAFAGQPLLAAIEPFHGNQVVVYRPAAGEEWRRLVIDTELVNGHSLLVADLSGDGNAEIVAAGTRGPQDLYLYRATDSTGDSWERSVIDNAISANSCVADDIDGDDATDVICIDTRAPYNIKWYENTGEW